MPSDLLGCGVQKGAVCLCNNCHSMNLRFDGKHGDEKC